MFHVNNFLSRQMHFSSGADLITIVLTAFSSLLAFLIALKKITAGEKEPHAFIFFLAMLCISLWRLGDAFNYMALFGVTASSPLRLSYLASIAYFFTCPLLYFYIYSDLSERSGFSGRILPHLLLPALMTLVLVTVIIAAPFLKDTPVPVAAIDRGLVRFATVINCLYSLALLWKMITMLYRGKREMNRFFLANIVIILAIIGTILAYLTGSKFMLSVLFILVISLFHIFGDFFYSSLELIRDEAVSEKYTRSRIRELNVDSVLQRIEELMSVEKVYRDEEISLRSFSQRLDLTPHQVSEILNSRMGVNFPTYVNNHRVSEAKMIFNEDRDASIITVAYRVGFSSLSSFYSAFKKITGMSPGSYQKTIYK